MFKQFCHILWQKYINKTFFVISIYCQSGVITNLRVGLDCVVISEIFEKMIHIIFTKREKFVALVWCSNNPVLNGTV